jgi:quercetin dioxygenase-like cupin family protein
MFVAAALDIGLLSCGTFFPNRDTANRDREARISSASTEMIQVGALSVRFLVEAADSNGSASVFECFVPADSKMPAPHSHDAFEETIYGLKGVTTWTVDGRTLDISPGEAFCVPRGAVHGFDNHGTEDAKFLAISSPGVMTPDYFREIHEVLASTPGGPPDIAKVAEVMRRHGLTPAPPAN